MDNVVQAFKKAFKNFGAIDIVEIVLMLILFFCVIQFLIGNKAYVLLGIFIAFVVGLSYITIVQGIDKIYFLLFVCFFILFSAVLYSKEIKRDFWGLSLISKENKLFKNDKSNATKSAGECIDEIIIALQNMSKSNIGALIILSDNNMPSSILESGVLINSEISSEIIESIFFPKTPLHDGAMIIKGKEIKYAGCFLPLSQQVNIPKDLGTRHRAGIGITEAINVISIIVSEENGIISIARGGKIERYADSDKLRETLSNYYRLELISER